MAADHAKICECLNEDVDVLEVFTGRLDQRVFCSCRGRSELFGGVFSYPNHFVEFIDSGGRRVTNITEWFRQLKCLSLINPEIGVDNVVGFFYQINIEVGVRIILRNQIHYFVALGHRAHDIFVADLINIRFLLLANLIVFPDVGRLPNLHGVVFLSGSIGLEIDQLSIFKDRKTVADDRCGDYLLNHVVGQ